MVYWLDLNGRSAFFISARAAGVNGILRGLVLAIGIIRVLPSNIRASILNISDNLIPVNSAILMMDLNSGVV